MAGNREEGSMREGGREGGRRDKRREVERVRECIPCSRRGCLQSVQ